MAERKFVDFKGKEDPVQECANHNFNGNFTAALSFLIGVGLDKWTDKQLDDFKLAEGKKKQS